jgi:aldehyde:ferredoxin oxidoreductase
MCNRSGLDTISAGTALAFAMECFENGIISESDTDGLAMTWGNAEAMIAMIAKMIAREGFGDILADGVKIAAEKIGSGGGQEPGLHNALFLPSRGTGFVCDPTPGRHTAAVMAAIDGGARQFAPYPELKIDKFEKYTYTGKGPTSATASRYLQVGASAGVCIMPMMFFGNYPLIEFFNAVTGWDLDADEVLTEWPGSRPRKKARWPVSPWMSTTWPANTARPWAGIRKAANPKQAHWKNWA